MTEWKHTRAWPQLDVAAKLAERDILRARLSMANPLEALATLAVRTADVLQGLGVAMAKEDLPELMHTLASNSTYAPSPRFPYTREAMRKALVATLTPAPPPYPYGPPVPQLHRSAQPTWR